MEVAILLPPLFFVLHRFKNCKALLRNSVFSYQKTHHETIVSAQIFIMSKENALDFLKQAADNASLSNQVKEAEHKDAIVNLAKQHGYEFSEDDMKKAVPVIKERSGFFGELAKAVLELFAPAHDDYPATGVQPFTGELGHKH